MKNNKQTLYEKLLLIYLVITFIFGFLFIHLENNKINIDNASIYLKDVSLSFIVLSILPSFILGYFLNKLFILCDRNVSLKISTSKSIFLFPTFISFILLVTAMFPFNYYFITDTEIWHFKVIENYKKNSILKCVNNNYNCSIRNKALNINSNEFKRKVSKSILGFYFIR